ncbi:MAG: ATP-binding protein [Armatimonadota bacterium]|nr:ATP-binding protein [Armatimonadota bacterium]
MKANRLRELVVISGKGGTGKTSIAASFAALAENKVMADCDVDASNLHLVLSPHILERREFVGGSKATVVTEKCVGCGRCAQLCRFDAFSFDGPANDVVAKTYRVDPLACEGCGVCAHFCPASAVDFSPRVTGEYYVSATRFGPFIHARLGIGGGNSGKLVTAVRREAVRVAEDNGLSLLIIDGAPGIGCPVIASLAGAGAALIIAEPTVSGLHDMERVAALAYHFGVQAYVCINKHDLNPAMSKAIERHARECGLAVLGKVCYDPAVTRAQMDGLSVIELGASNAAEDIRRLWNAVERVLYSS